MTASVAQLVSFQGDVAVRRAAVGAPASPGPLFAEDEVITGPASSAVIRFRDGRTIDVGENTRFRISGEEGAIGIEIAQGVIVSRTPAASAGPAIALSIGTPLGLSRVPADSQASFSVSSNGSQIEVRTGRILFVGRDGNERTAQAGESIELSLGSIRIVRAGEPPKSAPDRPLPETIVLDLRAERGVPLIRRHGKARFVAASKKAEPVGAGTLYRVPPGARAVLESRSVKVLLSDGATGSIGTALKEDGAEHYDLGLDKGVTGIALAGGATQEFRVAGPFGDVVVHAEEESNVTVAQTPRGPRVEVATGWVEVSHANEKTKLNAGEVGDFTRGVAHVGRRDRAALVLPAGRKQRVHHSGLKEVALAWPEGGEPNPRVEVASDAGFTERILSGRVARTFLNVTPPLSGELHWRVLGPDGQPRAVGQARFVADSGLSVLDLSHPHSEVADTGLKATVYFQSVLPAITFNYAEHEGGRRYRLRVYRAESLDTAVSDQTVAETHCTLEGGKLGEGSYVWYATPIGDDGAELSGGEMNKLDIVYDNSMTVLAIARPKPGEHVGGATVPVEGVAPLGAKLFVNGQAAPLDDKSRFALTVPKAAAVVFRVVDESGHENYWVRELGAAE